MAIYTNRLLYTGHLKFCAIDRQNNCFSLSKIAYHFIRTHCHDQPRTKAIFLLFRCNLSSECASQPQQTTDELRRIYMSSQVIWRSYNRSLDKKSLWTKVWKASLLMKCGGCARMEERKQVGTALLVERLCPGPAISEMVQLLIKSKLFVVGNIGDDSWAIQFDSELESRYSWKVN